MLNILPAGRIARREALWFYIFILPWIIGFIFFQGGPVLYSFYLSLTKYNIAQPPEWLGLAMLLNQKVPFLGVFRTLYYIPSLIAGSVAIALLFQWLLNPSFGIVNYVISYFVGPNGIIPIGYTGPKWFFTPEWVVPSFVLMSLWGVGGPMVIYLAGLQGVPTALYEAATIDGAGAWARFRHITIPMISPVIPSHLPISSLAA